MNLYDILILAALAAAVVGAVLFTRRRKGGCHGCSGCTGCAGCGKANLCPHAPDKRDGGAS